MDVRHAESIVRLGSRVPAPEPYVIGRVESIMNIAVPDHVVEPRGASTTTASSASTSTCAADDNSAACEKPVGSSAYTLPIILGIAIPIIGASIVFLLLHYRHVRKQREEDANDRHASLDFGLGDVPPPRRRGKGPSSTSDMDSAEKAKSQRKIQLSMDMNMSSPYLLPPELQSSRESLHSLSRTIHQTEDPYGPVTQYYPGEGGSIRSRSRQGIEGSSIYTGSSMAPSRLQEIGTSDLLSNAGSMARSTPPVAGFMPLPRLNSLPQKQSPLPIRPVETPPDGPLPLPPYPVELPQVHFPDSSSPPGGQKSFLPLSPRPGHGLSPSPSGNADFRESYASYNDAGLRASHNYLGAIINAEDPSPTPPSPPSKAPERDLLTIKRKTPPPAMNFLPASPRPIRAESTPAVEPPQTIMDDESEYGDGFKVTPPSPGRENHSMGMGGRRFSMDVPPEEFAQAGFGASGFDPRRLSMGFRPLPPDTVNDTDDPEVRANRIRSFYKEYFDETKPAPQGQYYEDYDESYLGDAAYYDPDSNNFVMPYAEPVTRRAMTPPPLGRRFQGQHRAIHASIGGMSMGGMRGPQMFSPGPRAFSSASGRMRQPGPKRPLPPPSDLTSLPTPSMLKDDSFATINPIDFAPPQTYRDRVAGRSESPLGMRHPYSPSVPSFAPIVSAFDELAPIPSPHMLRKSGTFTSLDFAPPKKFRDPDSMSETGSIRSNKSGVSSMQLGAIRGGAYRVSRIPKDVVFSKDDMETTLKPQWGMRAS